MSYESIINFYLVNMQTAKSSQRAMALAMALNTFLTLDGCFAPNIPAYAERRAMRVQ